MCFLCVHYRFPQACPRCRATQAICASDAPPHSKCSEEIARNGRLLFFVNPRSGTGKSVEVFRDKVLPKLSLNGIDYDLVVTESVNHAKSVVVSSEKLLDYSAICILSGDGLVFEVINGLLERKDGERCLRRLPIGIIPAGSGNGLLASVFHHRNIPLKKHTFVNDAIEHVCSLEARAYPVNLMHVQTPHASYAAFLSIGFGLIADLDIESERWRQLLGSARFTAGACARLCNLRTYHCRLSFLRSGEPEGTSLAGEPLKVYSSSGNCEKDEEESVGLEAFASTAPMNSYANVNATLRRHQIEEKIPDVSEPPPPHWEVIDDDFILIYAVTTSHISQNSPFMPMAQLNDPNIYLSYMLKKDLRCKWPLVKFLGDIDSGKHINHSIFKVIPVSAFRLESIEKPNHYGAMVVDGEVVDCTVLQAAITSLTTSIIAD